MTGLCPTCGHATEVQHIGRTRIPVEFCARCNIALGQLDDGQAQVMRLRDGRHLDDLAGDEYTHESLEGARAALAERIPPGTRPRAAYSEPVNE